MKMAFEYSGGSYQRLLFVNALRAEGFTATGNTATSTEQKYIIVETAPGHGYERVKAIMEANRQPNPTHTHE